MRAILNFGHTFGHAIESGLGYGQWLHGEAVACGMVQAAQLSALTQGLSATSVDRIYRLAQASGCPVVPPDLGTQRWIELMQVDKKTEGGELRFVVLPSIGTAQLKAVPMPALKQVLNATAGSLISKTEVV